MHSVPRSSVRRKSRPELAADDSVTVDFGVGIKLSDSERRKEHFPDAQAASRRQTREDRVARRLRTARHGKGEYAAEQARLTARAKPAVEFSGIEPIGGEIEIPRTGRRAAMQRTGPMRAKRLNGGEADSPLVAFNTTLADPTMSGWLNATLLNWRPRNSSVPLVAEVPRCSAPVQASLSATGLPPTIPCSSGGQTLRPGR